jgi:predicted transporter
MKSSVSLALEPSQVTLRLGMCAAALAGTAGMIGDANAVVITSNTPISVPANSDGIYINFLNGAATTPASNPGWDFNPYLINSVLTFFWPSNAASPSGGVASTATGPYLSLTPGTTISSASTFSQSAGVGGPAATVAFQSAGIHILGFRFLNETTATTNYGYLTISNGVTAGAAGFPATILSYSYENSGAAITVMAAVPETSTAAMMSLGALALGALNLRLVRRQRRQSRQLAS